MTNAQKILLRLSEVRSRLNEISGLEGDSFTDEIRAEAGTLQTEFADLEVRHRAAIVAEEKPEIITNNNGDAEQRERIQLRGKARLTNYLLCALSGKQVNGPELELRQAAKVDQIPLELFDVMPADVEKRADVTTAAPSSTGFNFDPIRPRIYARSVIPRLGVSMPRTQSGGFITATVSTGLDAKATAKGAKKESAAAVLTPKSTVPHRVSARLSITVEDVATIGTENFESVLRQNLMLAMSDELDRLGLNGDPSVTAAEPQGLLSQLADPTDPTAVIDFDGFVTLSANGIDGGPWAEGLGDVKLLVNADTARLAEVSFQSTSTYKGELSAGYYLRDKSGGFFASRRMPATATTIAQCLRVRMATMGMDGVDAMRLACMPTWAEIGIDDIFSDSGSGIRHFSLHNLVGDVLIEQPDAYQRVDVKIA